jgi:predicted dehydrogenase
MNPQLLIVGVGSIGERHLRCFQSTSRVELSLCETNPTLRSTIAERYQIERVYADLDSALASSPDAAVIATPSQLHIPMAQRAVRAGCDLLIEKPLSTSLDGIDELQALVAEKNAQVVIGYTWRSHPAAQAMRDALYSGRFGRPVEMVIQTGQNFPTFRPAYRQIYYTRRETGGGCIQDGLTHMLNLGEWMVGPMTRVAADAAHLMLPGVEVEDTAHVIARHGDVMASYNMNQFQAPNETTITVHCERGTLRCETHLARWRWMTEPEPNGIWHDEPIAPFERDFLYIRQAEAFLDTLENKREPLCTLDEAIQTLKVNLAVLRAADTATWQSV